MLKATKIYHAVLFIFSIWLLITYYAGGTIILRNIFNLPWAAAALINFAIVIIAGTCIVLEDRSMKDEFLVDENMNLTGASTNTNQKHEGEAK